MSEPQTVFKPYRYERPSHGEWGSLSFIGPDRVVCHACGRDYLLLGPHIWRMHGLTAVEYRQAFGLPASLALAGKRSRVLKSEINRRFGGTRNLVMPVAGGHLEGRRLEESLRHLAKATDVSAARRKAGLSRQYRNPYMGLLAACRRLIAGWEAGDRTIVEGAIADVAQILRRLVAASAASQTAETRDSEHK